MGLRAIKELQVKKTKNIIELAVLVKQYKEADEAKWETNFVRGQLLDAMVKLGASKEYLSKQLNIKTERITQLILVYQSFKEEIDREPKLSWSHHQLALKTNDPAATLKKSVDEKLTTTELADFIYQRRTPRLSANEKEATREIFNMVVTTMSKRLIELPDWQDTLSVYIWWTKALKSLSTIEMAAVYAMFKVDESDSQLAERMVEAIEEEVDNRKRSVRNDATTYDVGFLLDGKKRK